MTAASDFRELLSGEFLSLEAGEPACRLPRGTAVIDVARECRRALAEFLSTCRSSADVDAWLAGPYRAVTEHVHAPARVAEVPEIPAVARAYVLGVIRDLARDDGDATFVLAAAKNGGIERCVDATGRPGWVPVDRPKMRVTERLLSLLAVDYLVRRDGWLGGAIPSDLECATTAATLPRIAV